MEPDQEINGSLELESRLKQLEKQSNDLYMQLGASLYETTKCDENLRSGRESIYEALENCRLDSLRIKQLLEMVEAKESIPEAWICPVCDADVDSTDTFCWSCGSPLGEEGEKAVQAAGVYVTTDGSILCPRCKEPVNAEDKFCMCCGKRLNV